jgi:cellulose synthase/poly-beta-1,6-N-acetylglucosamine synthase-like glycosyltransferase
MEMALGRCDIITFFDDDFLSADDYLRRLEGAFEGHPDWAVIMGMPLSMERETLDTHSMKG